MSWYYVYFKIWYYFVKNIQNLKKESDINSLNVIHITGTKGKGSTCAFIESILRHSDLKTGLFR